MGKPSPTIIASLIFTTCLFALMLVIGLCGGFDSKDRWTKAELQQLIREELKR
jgi:ABC-type transporter Mla maintaining outer membrane lipid asymmetry permease subunit MlaE